MAARLSLDHGYDHDDASSRDPGLGGCCTTLLDSSGTLHYSSDPEAVLRDLFDQINMADYGSDTRNHSYGSMCGGLGIKIVQGPSPNLISVEFSDVLTAFIRRLCGQGNDIESKKYIEELICKILSEKMVNFKSKSVVDDDCSLQAQNEPSCSSVTISEKCEEPLLNMLKQLKEVAACPWVPSESGMEHESQKWSCMILASRRILSPMTEQNMNGEEFPYLKRQKIRRNLCERSRCTPSIFHSNDFVDDMKDNHPMLYLPRRSRRILGQVKLDEGHLPRKRIPIGSSFQADVPEWKGQIVSSCYKISSDLRWLGTRIWPTEACNMKADEVLIGRGRPDMCSCCSLSSVACIKYHVRKARHQLHRELGQAFYKMGFDNMGEEVANSWSLDEQLKFDNLVRTNPLSEGKTFWYPALSFFPSKSRQVLVSYYFNVHVHRRMSYRTRMPDIDVDSDDDECDRQAYGRQKYSYAHPQGRYCKKICSSI